MSGGGGGRSFAVAFDTTFCKQRGPRLPALPFLVIHVGTNGWKKWKKKTFGVVAHFYFFRAPPPRSLIGWIFLLPADVGLGINARARKRYPSAPHPAPAPCPVFLQQQGDALGLLGSVS